LAVGLTAELLEEFEPEIESITLVPAEGGQFEVTINDKLVFSKLREHRHVEPGEVVGRLRSLLREGI
jgi:selenoprotein W-related protein